MGTSRHGLNVLCDQLQPSPPSLPAPASVLPSQPFLYIPSTRHHSLSSAPWPTMASLARNPLATKPHANLIPGFSLQNTLRKLATSVKRSRSPDPVESIKRPRPTPEAVRIAAAARDESRRRDAREREHREAKEERERKRADKEEEFRIKYTRAFPSWTFYFDFDDPSAELSALKDKVVKRLLQLNAVGWRCPNPASRHAHVGYRGSMTSSRRRSLTLLRSNQTSFPGIRRTQGPKGEHH